MTDPDPRLARQAVQGDRDAMTRLYERHRDRLFGFVVRICGRRGAEDVFQEVWIHVIRRIDQFDSRRGTFAAWIHAIAANAALDRGRRERVRDTESLDVPAVESGPDRIDLVPSRGPSPDAIAIAAPLREALERALSRLDPERRAAVLLRHHAGMSYAEIAGALGVPEGTAKSMVHRGVVELRESLEAWHDVRS